MKAKELFDNLTERGFALSVENKGTTLIVGGGSKLSPDEAAAIRQYKPQLIELFYAPHRPYIDAAGDLWIPLKSHPRYHYWAGGQPLTVILAEINAPLSVWRFYSRRNDDLLTDGHAKRCKGAVVDAGGVVYCRDCNYFVEREAQANAAN
jgi:hypothetical protein